MNAGGRDAARRARSRRLGLAIGVSACAALAGGLLGAGEPAIGGEPGCTPEIELCIGEDRTPTAPGALTYRGPLAAGELEVIADGDGTRRRLEVTDTGSDATTRTWRALIPPGLKRGETSFIAISASGLERRDTLRVRGLLTRSRLAIDKRGPDRVAALSLRSRGPVAARLRVEVRAAYPAERSERIRRLSRRKAFAGGAGSLRVPVRRIEKVCRRFGSCRIEARARIEGYGERLRGLRERRGVPTGRERPTGRLGFVSDPTPSAGSGGRSYRYAVYVERGIKIDRRDFSRRLFATLSDRRSWIRSGRVSFRGVGRSGQANTRIILASPPLVDRLCAPLATQGYVSCTQGSSVILNLDRWRYAVPHFRSRLTYRRMLVNHEVGHRIGQGHRSCPRGGARAPVMQQQTYGLQGCRANPWPLRGELGSAKLAAPPASG